MNRLERIDDSQAAMIEALRGWQAGVYTAMPAIVQSFDAAKMTCTATVAIKARVQAADGSVSWVELPLLRDVPVVFPGGGGYALTFPVVAGNEALILFASRCIDDWWLAGGVQQAPDLRMHDLSDGFALVGVRSQAHVLPGGVPSTGARLTADDASAYIELSGNKVNILAPGGVFMNGKRVDETHVHGGVSSGPSNTGAVA